MMLGRQDIETGGFHRTGVSGIATSRGLGGAQACRNVWAVSKDKGRNRLSRIIEMFSPAETSLAERRATAF
jgi:hypothetical protein